MWACEAVVDVDSLNSHFCGKLAVWRGKWSDRVLYVCDGCRDFVREAHQGDHSYDQTGIIWESCTGEFEYESTDVLKEWERRNDSKSI